MSSEKPRCRLCMHHKPYLATLFRRSLSMKVMELADVQVMENDGLPTVVCIDCENAVEKCYSFRTQIQWADKKFREEMSVSLVEVEECSIKEEHGDFMEDDSDLHSDRGHNDDAAKGTGDKGQDGPVIPLNHVEVMETIETGNQVQMIDDPQGQAEPLIEAPFAAKEEERAMDPLICTKEEDVSMESDTNSATSAPASTSDFPVMGENLARSCNISSADNTGSQIKSESKTFLQNHQDGSILRSKLTQIEPPTKRLRYKKIKPKVAGGKVSTFHNVDSVGPTVLAQVVSKNLGAPFGHTEQQLVSGVQVPTLRNINSSIMPTVLAQVAPTNVAGMALNFCVPVNNQLILIGPNMCVNGINAGHSQSNISYLPQALTQSTSKDNKNLNIKFDTLKSQQNTVDQFNKKPTEKSLLSSNNDVEHIISESSHLSDNSISKNATTSYCKVDSEKKETATSVSLCRVCNVECGNIELLHKHLEREDLICRVCTAEFCDHKELETHFFSHKPYKCTVCQEVFFDKTSLFAHRKGSGSCSYLKQQCKMCNKQFSSQRSLNKHSLLYHVKRNKKYKCVVCTKKFNTPGLLSRHEQSCHTVYEVVECNICQKLLDGPERLKIHVKAWHLDCDEDCGSACPICGKIFHSKNLKQHLETHDSESLCEVCGKSVKGKSTMRKHMQRMHPKSGKFLCKHCNDEFDNELTFLQHKKKVHSSHSNPLPVYCEICGKVYKSATMLKMHKAIHSNEKPFKCETCGASFKQKVTLNTHRRVHSSVGKYSCDNCGKTFKWKQTFDKHVEKCVDDLNDD